VIQLLLQISALIYSNCYKLHPIVTLQISAFIQIYILTNLYFIFVGLTTHINTDPIRFVTKEANTKMLFILFWTLPLLRPLMI